MLLSLRVLRPATLATMHVPAVDDVPAAVLPKMNNKTWVEQGNGSRAPLASSNNRHVMYTLEDNI